MRIVFLCSNQNINVGSYRIWIHDLQRTFKELNIESDICSPYDDITISPENDILILSKGDANLSHVIRSSFPSAKIGVINLDAELKNLPIDFVIVGSIEEMDSVSAYYNVFLYPLIERMFDSIKQKEHQETGNIKICFHGHYPHLSKFNPHLTSAIEEYAKSQDVELKIITGDPNFKWDIGKPSINKITYKKWDYSTIADEIQYCDIGVVPNITDYSSQVRNVTNKNLGLYETDYCLRFKNKSNAGRCFVFHQLGIPVIADLTPSNFHIMGDTKNGYLALSKDGWLRALKKLADPSHRNEIAKNAKETFDLLYDPHDWANRLIAGIKEMMNE